ncbi:Chitinase 1 [Mortierella alpina]|uniref:chitinase n=1 Tax=Mortierella alpina TaxID=64518 RepID=A0A9P6JA41_MORAP|nr:Chitinase 1 [Mortierella alpina]
MRPILPRIVLLIAAVLFLIPPITTFDASARNNLVNYWGQNGASSEGDLAEYCQNDTIDILVLAFLAQIQDNLPGLNFANHCKETYPGTSILHCPKMAQDIKFCQSKGKAVILSIGGASGSYAIGDNAAGQAFAKTVWDMFLGGSSDTRPFEDAILDGVDLDLEDGATQGYVGFLQTLRENFRLITPVLHHRGPSMPHAGPLARTYDAWNEWATSSSINKSVKIYLGVPGGPDAAGSNVLSADQLVEVIRKVQSYSNFGGVMMWDAGFASVSGLAVVAARAMSGDGRERDPVPPTLPSPHEPSPSPDHPAPDEPSPEYPEWPKYPERPEAPCPEAPWNPWTGDRGWPDWPDLPQRPKDSWRNKRADSIQGRSFPSPDHIVQRITAMPSPGSKISTRGVKTMISPGMRMTKSEPTPIHGASKKTSGVETYPS